MATWREGSQVIENNQEDEVTIKMKIILMKSHQSLRQKHRGRQNRAGKPATTKTLAGHKVNLKVVFDSDF